MATHSLLDMRSVLGITAASKSKAADGTYFILLQIKMAPKKGPFDGGRSAGLAENLELELTVQQFYHLLSEFEEAKIALASAEK